jgi:sigma-B regulation protein RsbU (phosphoserine phosphatase)
MAVFTQFNNWKCDNCFGVDAQFTKANHKKDLLSFHSITHLKKNKHPFASEFDIVVPVFHKNQPLAYTLLGGISNLKGISLEERLTYIQTISNIIAVAIENKKLFKEQLVQQGLKKELELAGQMQTMLIPEHLPKDERMEMAAVYLPHLDVGGDYYDAFELNEDEYMFCMGDISGQGIAAALLMANFQASLRGLTRKQDSLTDSIRELNTKVNEITRGEKFITLFLAKYNFYTRTLQYVNAGHNPPILITNGEVKLLEEGSTILGMFDRLPSVKSGQVHIENEGFLLCYTDGLTELENEKKQDFGPERLAEFAKENYHKPVEQFNNDLVDYLVTFKGKQLFGDDISVLSCRFFAGK